MTLKQLWAGATDFATTKNLFNRQVNDNRLLPNIIIITQEDGELAIMKVLQREMFYRRCCRGGPVLPFRMPGRQIVLPGVVLVVYDGRRNILDQTHEFEDILNNCRTKLGFTQISDLSSLRNNLVIAYHHVNMENFPQEVRGDADVLCLEINTRTGDGVLPLLEAINNFEPRGRRGLVVFLPA